MRTGTQDSDAVRLGLCQATLCRHRQPVAKLLAVVSGVMLGGRFERPAEAGQWTRKGHIVMLAHLRAADVTMLAVWKSSPLTSSRTTGRSEVSHARLLSTGVRLPR
jgi:hypothetical protein